MDVPSSPLIRPVLVYDRIEKNERDTRLLIGLFVLLVLPAMAFLVEYGAVWLLMFSPSLMTQVQSEQQMLGLWILSAGVILLVLLAIAIFRYRSAAESTLELVGARQPRTEESGLVRALENLCLGAGLPVPALYVVDTSVPNAFSVGLAPERSSLVVTRGLLDLLDRLELEGVLAHELSHIGNRDSRLNTVLSVMLRTLVLPFPIQVVLGLGLVFSLPMLFSAGEFFREFPPGIRFLMVLQTVLVIWALAWPWIGRLTQRAVGRRREFLADADAVRLTRYPEGLARALCKAGSAMAANPLTAQPAAWGNPALSHLFLLSLSGMGRFLDPHPSVEARVAELAGMDPLIREEVLARASEAGVAHAQSSSDVSQSAKTEEGADWIDRVPAMFRAGLAGLRNGLLSMAAFFALSGVLPWLLGGHVSPDDAMTSLLIAASLGYAVAGYVAARQFAPQHRLALLGSCFVLYLLWMVLAVAIFASTGSALSAGAFLRRLLACLILVPIGAVAGAMVQAAFVMGLFGALRLRLWRSEQSRTGRYRFLDSEDRVTSDVQKIAAKVESEGQNRPSVPAPEHRIPCPHCGAMMSDTDTVCVWCGHKTGA